MSWVQLTLHSDPESAARLEALMEESGAVSVTMADAADQPLFEPPPGETPLWREVLVTALYPGGSDPDTLIAALQEAYRPLRLPAVNASILPDQDWERAWMDDFQPMRFGERLWICPSWCAAPDPDAVNLLLDPGLAFGTGTHPTTSLCLQWLDSAALSGNRLVDYGCGSGVLAIAALLLGAASVLCVDNDPQALAATRDNCAENGIEEARCPVFLPADFDRERQGQAPLDGLLANILAEPLIALAPRFAELVKPRGFVLLSGILEKQAADVAAAYAPWFEMEPAALQEGWVRLEGRRRADKPPADEQ